MTEVKVTARPVAKAVVASKPVETKAVETILVKKVEAVPAKKAASVKKVAPAEKAAPAKKAAPVKKATSVKETIHFQFAGKSYEQSELMKIAMNVWKYDLKQKPADIKSIELYVKPEEGMAYYVFNDDIMGSFML